MVDYFSPEATKYRRRKGMDRQMLNAPFRFEPGNWLGFFREHDWQARESRFLMEEGERLDRPMPIPWPIRTVWSFWSVFLSDERRESLRRFAGYILLKPL